MVQRIKEDSIEKSIINLRSWVSLKCEPEATEKMVKEIQKLKTKDAISAVESLKDRCKFIQGTKGQDLKFSINVEDIQNGTMVETKALLNCGTTGSCINQKFIEKYQLPIWKILIKIPVYNANGSLNADGSIKGYCELQVTIGDHAERIEFGVINLGNTNIFLGQTGSIIITLTLIGQIPCYPLIAVLLNAAIFLGGTTLRRERC